jgi:hypothetical protein
MKTKLVRIVMGVMVLLLLGLVALGFFLGDAIKHGVEAFGPKLAKVDIKLESVRVSLFSGAGSIRGLVVGNPPEFKTPEAIRVGGASLEISPASLLSGKVVIKSIQVHSPLITFEGGLAGSNLGKIIANLNEISADGSAGKAPPVQSAPPKPGKKLEVDDFLITGARLNLSVAGLMGGKSVPVLLPDIHLTALGTGPEGITGVELTKRVVSALEQASAKAAAGAAGDLGKNAVGLLNKTLAGGGSNTLDKVKGLGGFLKKNQTAH